jgi:hypothetical protein
MKNINKTQMKIKNKNLKQFGFYFFNSKNRFRKNNEGHKRIFGCLRET